MTMIKFVVALALTFASLATVPAAAGPYCQEDLGYGRTSSFGCGGWGAFANAPAATRGRGGLRPIAIAFPAGGDHAQLNHIVDLRDRRCRRRGRDRHRCHRPGPRASTNRTRELGRLGQSLRTRAVGDGLSRLPSAGNSNELFLTARATSSNELTRRAPNNEHTIKWGGPGRAERTTVSRGSAFWRLPDAACDLWPPHFLGYDIDYIPHLCYVAPSSLMRGVF